MGNSTGSLPEDVLVGGALQATLSCCSWEQRAAAPALSRAFREARGLHGPSHGNEEHWRFLCAVAAEELSLYAPEPAPGGAPPACFGCSWRELFLELYSQSRERGDEEGQEEVFKINVAARFRPMESATFESANEAVLPLHQKVQLVREKFGCSSREAVALIMQSRQKQIKKDLNPAEDSVFLPCLAHGHHGEDKENVEINSTSSEDVQGKEELPSLKGGPLQNATKELGSDMLDSAYVRCAILSMSEENASVLAMTKTSGLREFAFDRVFKDDAMQDRVYDDSARRLVMEFLNGRSASVICYGQTGSGKTFTMFGPESSAATPLDASIPPEFRGLVPRACEEVLGTMKRWRRKGTDVQLAVSYVEIFGSEISDLLQDGQVVGQGMEGRYGNVRATDRVGHRYVLDGNTEVLVESLSDVQRLLSLGDASKRRAATAMNERSTRAHAIFVMTLRAGKRESRFFWADLGGSEQLNKSQAAEGTRAPVVVVGGVEQSRVTWGEYYHHRQRVQETLNINMGLFSLKRVLEALHQRSRMAREGRPPHQLPYVPYQDSKLTMLLKEALGGSARTLVITTATLDPRHMEESMQTIRFAETCAQVEKHKGADQAASVRLALTRIAAELEGLEAEIRRKERWETRLVHRRDVDTVAGAFGEGQTFERQELIHKSVLVGAENERARLEQLLQQQAELQGLTDMGGLGKDFRDLMEGQQGANKDGGRGTDFRESDRFSSRTRARDFEQAHVLAEALRFLFRRAPGAAAAFGETELSVQKRLASRLIPGGYYKLARALREKWEVQSETGEDFRSFGKAMLDLTQAWARECRQEAKREEALQQLLKEASYAPEEEDLLQVPHLQKQPAIPEENSDPEKF